MEFVNYYKVLGVSSSATQVEIQSSIEKLLIKYHPENQKNKTQALASKQKYQSIEMAQKTLGDVEQRKKYNEQFKKELFPIKIDPRAKRTTVKCPSAPNEAAEDCYSSAKPQSEVKYSFNTPSNGQHMISHIYGGVLLTQTTINRDGEHVTEFFQGADLKRKTTLNSKTLSHKTEIFEKGQLTAEY